MSEERPAADASLGFTYRNHMGRPRDVILPSGNEELFDKVPT